jgi:hypothetical protein
MQVAAHRRRVEPDGLFFRALPGDRTADASIQDRSTLMAKGQITRRTRKQEETRTRGRNNTQHKGQEPASRAVRQTAAEIAQGQRRAIDTQQRTLKGGLRQVQRAMKDTRQAAVAAVERGEEATRRTARTWDTLFNIGPSVDLTRSWMAAALSIWDATTSPLRHMMGQQTTRGSRR